jgi:hypothetical protein
MSPTASSAIIRRPSATRTINSVPYAHLANPQSLNLYAYVMNSPVTTPDLDGHDALDSDGIAAQQQQDEQEGYNSYVNDTTSPRPKEKKSKAQKMKTNIIFSSS